MKTCVSLGLLVLLLSHSLGSSVAMLCLGKAFQSSKPAPERDDTLLVNPSAWHRFAELSELMQEMDQAKAPPTPLGSILKMLHDLAKTYLPVYCVTGGREVGIELARARVRFAEMACVPVAGMYNRATPPPEMTGSVLKSAAIA